MRHSKQLGALLWLSAALSLSAQTTNTWSGGGTDNNWSTAANWGGTAPVSGNALKFSGTVRQTNTNDISGLVNLGAITFSTAGWNISGNAVTVTNNFYETATGLNTWGLNTTLGNTISIAQSAAGDILNFTGVLSGSGGVSTVAGSGGVGTVYLSNTNNSFTGAVAINSATGVFYSMANGGQNSSLGAGSGMVTFGSTATAYEGSLIYAGTSSCSSTLTFEGVARTTGSPTFSNNSPNNSSLTFNGNWIGKGSLNPFTMIFQGGSTGTNTFNSTISQSSSYPVSLHVNGPGTWVFAANNTYQGTTTLSGGVLQLGGGGTTGNAGSTSANSIIFGASGTLVINRSDSPVFVNTITLGGNDTLTVASGRTATLGGAISGSGNLVNNSSNGRLILGSANTYTGNTTISAGTLALGATGSLPNSPAINIAAGTVFDVSAVSGGFTLGANQTINGLGATGILNGNVNLAAGSLALAYVPGTPTLTVTAGVLTMSNNSVIVTVPVNTALPVGSYLLISPGSGGSVSGSVSNSAVSANDTGNQTVSLQITNGGLYLVVNPSTATIPTVAALSSSLNPATYGTVPMIFTATVSPASTNGETVIFMDGTNTLAVGTLTNGATAFSTTTLGIGTHLITAAYGGDALLMPSTSGVVTQVVNQVAVCYPQGTAFPLFMYEITPTYPSLSQYGWNIMQEYGLNTNSDVNNYLQGLLPNNVAGVAILPATAGTGTYAPDPYTGWTQTQISNWVQSIAYNTNLAWWSLPEELKPNNWSSEATLMKNYLSWMRLYDPAQRPNYEYTPNYFADTDMSGVANYVDVIGVSCYCEADSMPHAWVRYKMQQVGGNGTALAGKTIGANYLAGQKTLVAVLYDAQAVGYTPSEPTPAQTYHDFWSAIASGAQGIAVYAHYHALNDDPANLTNNLNQLNLAASQITGPEQIGNVILYGTANPIVTFNITAGPTNTVSFTPNSGGPTYQYPSINVLSKTWNGNVYVIAVNSTSNTVTATVSNVPSSLALATLPFESRSVPMTNGSFSDTFPAWGVHIYKMASTTASLVAPLLYSSSVSAGGGAFTLSFSGASGQSYRILTSTNLALPFANWQVLTSGTFGVSLVNFTDNAATNGQEFYSIASP
jgi:autotransporter-associated beta strand protein